MHRALELARRAEGATSPNPLVGCVIVKDGKIVGEGWHRASGLPHAEIEAIRVAQALCHGATMYVTLEPCSHHGRTPPCTDAIINAGIKSVIYAIADPNPVASEGAKLLRQAGIETISNINSAEATWLNRFYLHHLRTGRPYVIAKYAASLDGRIATHTGNSKWITGPAARLRSHALRQAVDAIVIGAQTAIDDDPQLTVRMSDSECPAENTRHPLRILLDGQARVPLDRRLLTGELPGSTLVLTSGCMSTEHETVLQDRGIEVIRTQPLAGSTNMDIDELLQILGLRSLQSLLVEGGQALLGSFLDARKIDEVWAFIAPLLIGGREALSPFGGLGIDRLADAPHLSNIRTEQCGDDLLIQGQLNYNVETA